MAQSAVQLDIMRGGWMEMVDGQPLPSKRTPTATTIAFRECVVGIDMAGRVRFDVVATSAHLSLEACQEWMYKGAVIGDIEIHRYETRNAGSFRTIVQQICNVILRDRDIVAVYVCIDADDNITYRAITRREVPVYETL